MSIPRNIVHTGGVASVDKQQLRRTVLRLLRRLLLPDAAQVPHDDTAVHSRGGHHTSHRGRPGSAEHGVGVAFEHVERESQIAEVPQRGRVVRGSGEEEVRIKRRELQHIDFLGMEGRVANGSVLAEIVQRQHPVIPHRPQDVCVVPRNVLLGRGEKSRHLDDAMAILPLRYRLQRIRRPGVRADVPHADAGVVSSTRNPPRLECTPLQSVAVALVSRQLQRLDDFL